MGYEEVRYEVDAGIATITLYRPDVAWCVALGGFGGPTWCRAA